jgi:hypothetical protein
MKKILTLLATLIFGVSPAFAEVAALATNAVVSAKNITPYDCSGFVTTGGVSQLVIPTVGSASTNTPNLRGMMITNLDTTEPMWINFTGPASLTAGSSYPLAALNSTTSPGGGSFMTPLGFGFNSNFSVTAATTNHRWACTYW